MNPTGNDSFRQRLLELLGNPPATAEGEDSWGAAADSPPRKPAPAPRPAPACEPERPAVEAGSTSGTPMPGHGEFVPLAPATLDETGLSRAEIEALALKCLLHCGAMSGRAVADQMRLPFRLLEEVLRQLKDGLLVVYKTAAPLSDYVYELTEPGFERARRHAQRSTYFGTAPVSLAAYTASVEAQSVTRQKPRLADLRRAFADLVVSEQVLSQVGQAISSGLGLFLYGAPGNGKTSFAERLTRAFGESVWIPRAISVFGEILRLYDPSNHQALPMPEAEPSETPWIDKRWVRVRRPTIIVGGELTMDSLEITANTGTGISESPLQMKANCGTLVIDDFGRQRITTSELLNRWIVPLEKRYDYLNLANGRKIQVPFDQLIVFATNLEPEHLVDEAFLRRIPYKIDVPDPTEAEFRRLFRSLAAAMGIEFREEALEYLLEVHYRGSERAMRFCHPRDLLRQVGTYCAFLEAPRALTRAAIDAAVRNYFAMMPSR